VMKDFAFAVLLIVALAVWPGVAAADDIDDLLASEPSPAVAPISESAPATSTVFGQDLFGTPVTFEPSSITGELDWQPAERVAQPSAHPQPGAPAAAHQAAAPTDPKASPAPGINLVPEPSAIALAVLAMLYFLVFGRRRVVV
jgi:hypothetical protein